MQNGVKNGGSHVILMKLPAKLEGIDAQIEVAYDR